MQHVELCFVPAKPIGWGEFTEALRGAGIECRSTDPVLRWCRWPRKGEVVEVAAALHRDFYGRDLDFVEVGFDNGILEGRPVEDSARVLEAFVAVGKDLWGRCEFSEGHLAPEDDGWFLVSEPRQWLESEPVPNVYASFLRAEILDRRDFADWILRSHPRAKVESLHRGSVSIVWDDSLEGVRRFLSDCG